MRTWAKSHVRQLRHVRQRASSVSTPAHGICCCCDAGLFSKELFESSRAYSIDKFKFSFVHGQFSLLEQVAQLYFGFLPWLWYITPRIMPQQLVATEIGHTVCFVLLSSLASLLTSLPWSYYSTCELQRSTCTKQKHSPKSVCHAQWPSLGL
jgi:hypothetical protein